ncbi:MAG: cytochrome c maturation protein CcmE [Aestuariivirga sp.]|uniref:cytochrome c maturation protein CcmE n=1 Tax=Aestuariivirga sp. TaxID=2650926 RepID=UPI0025C5E7A5|nr:cytochrome c maturation protein CcmE [Aestuariivirga sp.]MCA3561472.1 cytochrome c maturation protein CcmE [Aestuariivirga sp.]
MTRKQKRLSLILGGLAVLGLAAGLVLYALSGTITFFHTPSDLADTHVQAGQRIRLGGMVENGSVKKGPGTVTSFAVTDTLQTVTVSYDGILPDLFREGQGVVTEGKMQPDGTFVADTVLAKHDENYMPRELANSLKEKGVKLGKGAGQ